MDTVCRLCLSFNTENTKDLFENPDILNKISSTLHIVIAQETFLPKLVCDSCVGVIEHIHNFHQIVTKAQNVLNDKLEQGIEYLQDYFNSLKYVKIEHTDLVENIKLESNEIDINEERKNDKVLTKMQELEIYNAIEELIISSESDMAIKEEHELKKYPSDSNINSDYNWTPPRKKLKVTDITKKALKKDLKKKRLTYKNISPSRLNDSTKQNNKNKLIHSSTNNTTHDNRDVYKCLTCFEKFYSITEIKDHYKKEHKPSEIWSKGIDKNNFVRIEQNNNIMYKCGYCKKIKKSVKGVTGHIKAVHNQIRPYVCNLCGTTFKTIDKIFDHHNRVHYEGVKFCCSFKCGYSTSSKGNLKEHEQRHTEKYKFKCDTCGKGFFVRQWLEDHMNEHRGVKPYVCGVCGAAYFYKKDLRRHETSVHQIENISTNNRLFCIHCSYACTSKVILNIHLNKVHDIKQTHLCDICGKSYKRRTNLMSHKKLHGNRTYVCSKCDKSFFLSSHLRRHEKTHLPLKPYPCGNCEKRFARPEGLRHHKLSCRVKK